MAYFFFNHSYCCIVSPTAWRPGGATVRRAGAAHRPPAMPHLPIPMKKYSPLSLWLVYCLCALAALFYWQRTNFNSVTGDEPHYLVMANGVARHAALEQTVPYTEAFKPGQNGKFGLAESDGFQPEQTHTVRGANGYFNVHNLGLPALLAAPFLLDGIVGAKLLMILFGGLVVVLSWKVAGLYTAEPKIRWFAVLAASVAYPLIPAGSQIYPEILAGALSLLGLYWFVTTHKRRGAGRELLLTLAIVYLPWLQIKFGLTCAVLVVAVAAKIYGESKDVTRVARIFALAAISCLVLAAYNFYAFGKVSGPYTGGAVEVSMTSLMVLMGLLFDQNHGVLMQNPVNFLGLLAIGGLYRTDRRFALLWTAVFLSMIVPNAMHPNWYGGWSFSGRFGWAAAIVFMIPTLRVLIALANRRPALFRAVVALSLLAQAYFFYRYVFRLADLYNSNAPKPFSEYSIFYHGIHTSLPALYDVKWAYTHAPNYAFLAVTVALLARGFLRGDHARRAGNYALALALATVVAAAWYQMPKRVNVALRFAAATLPSLTGRIEGGARVAEAGVDKAGFVNFGPYTLLERAKYKVTVRYSGAAPAAESLAVFDVTSTTLSRQLLSCELPGTDGAVREVAIEFETAGWDPQRLEFRTNWKGKRPFTLYEIRVDDIAR